MQPGAERAQRLAASSQYKVTAKVVGPENYDPQAELSELQKAVAAKPAGILISVADVSVLGPAMIPQSAQVSR